VSGYVLLADDEASVREELGELLSERGYEVRLAANVKELENELRSPPDVALLDVQLGPTSTVDWLAENDLCARVPVVLLSGTAELDEVVRGLAFGACDFVHKTDSPERLLLAVGDARARARVPIDAVLALERFRDSATLPAEVCEALLARRLRCVAEIQHGGQRHVVLRETPGQTPPPARQVSIARRLVAAEPIKAIAAELAISEATVWSELGALQSALGFRDRFQLLRILTPLIRA
jgi:DNA-binding NarL/FixJ family response regulator